LFGVAVLTLGFGLLAEEVMEGDTKAFDAHVAGVFRVAGATSPIGPPWLQEMARDVTSLGSFALLGIVLGIVVGYLLLLRKRSAAFLMGASVLSGVLLSTVLKMGFDRPRPDIPETVRVFTASFPSGHATLSAITYLTLGALMTRVEAHRRVKAYVISVAVFLTLIVGLSRLYLGVHYATDVLAGWCVGSSWALLCWSLAYWLQRRGRIERPSTVAAGVQP
jgi:undecaprenyl-diphosphatase